MDQEDKQFFEFSDFRFDSNGGRLWRNDELISLSSKSSELLTLLLERNGEFVSKDEIFGSIWNDTFVEDGVLTQNIYILRKVLGKTPDGQQMIENKARFGYRITVPVRLGTSAPNLVPAEAAAVPRRRATRSFLFAAIAMGLLLVIGFFAYRALFPTFTVSTSKIEKIRFRKVTDTGKVGFPALSPNGEYAAYAVNDFIVVNDLSASNETRLEIPGNKRIGFMQFSADGESIFFRNRASVFLPSELLNVSRFGGPAKKVAENVWGGFSVSRDGRLLAFVRSVPTENRHAIVIRELENGSESEVVSVTSPEEIRLRSGPALSSDAGRIAFIVERQNQGFDHVAIVDVKSKRNEKLKFKNLRQVESVVWGANDERLLIAGSEMKFYQLWEYGFSSGNLSRLTNDFNNYLYLTISADGKKLLSTQYNFYLNLWMLSADDLSEEKQLTFGISNRDGYLGIDHFPDGQIVYYSNEGESGDGNLWRMDPATGERRQLTKKAGKRNESPAVSSDGRHVYFVSDRTGKLAIWEIEADGSNPRQVTAAEGGNDLYPQTSPDGKWLYFIRKSGKSSHVIRRSLSDGSESSLLDGKNLSPASFLALSPDGRYLAFQNLTEKIEAGNVSQAYQLAVVEVDAPGNVTFLSAGGRRPEMFWLPDGSGFDILTPKSEGDEILRRSLDPNVEPKTIRRFPNEVVFTISRSPKDGSIIVGRGREQNDAVLLTNIE